MSNVFTRMADSISADIHQMLDNKEEKNPIAALNHYLRQSEQQKDKVKKLLQRQYQLKEEFTSEYHQAQDQADKRYKQAQIAKQANEDDLFDFAQREYEEYHARAVRMKQAREDTVQQIDQLERRYKEMTHKLKDMHLKRMELMGRENVARTNHQLNSVLDGNGSKSYDKFQELEQFIDKIEKKVNHAYYESTFDQKIADLEKTFSAGKESNQI